VRDVGQGGDDDDDGDCHGDDGNGDDDDDDCNSASRMKCGLPAGGVTAVAPKLPDGGVTAVAPNVHQRVSESFHASCTRAYRATRLYRHSTRNMAYPAECFFDVVRTAR
jgi:hypothetical protein